MTDLKFCKNEFYIVTGASSGIGRECALLLNKLGASVIAVGRNVDRLNKVRDCALHSEYFYCFERDLSEDQDNLPAFVTFLKDQFGKLRGLCLCAGVPQILPLRMVNLKKITEVMKVNYIAPILLAKGFLDRRVNVGDGSAILAIASGGGVFPDPGSSSYDASKAALIAGMKSISKESARYGVRVNCISPALVDTPMAGEVARENALGKYPLGIGKPEDVANLAVFLLSNAARWITGQNYILDGGVY